MSDNDGKKTLGLRGGPRSGNVKQSFSHGRTKNVVVETKRKRVVVPKPGAAKPTGSGAVGSGNPAKRPAGITDVEMDRRLKAVQAAKAREAEDIARRAAEEKARAEDRERRRAEIDAKEAEERARAERAKEKAEADAAAKREAEEVARRAAAAPAPAEPSVTPPTPSRGTPNKPAPAATPRKSDSAIRAARAQMMVAVRAS
jgi:translation initiation factor IF-2